MDKRCIIIIPVYKTLPTFAEIESLKQALTVLSAHNFCLICAKNFDTTAYDHVIKDFKNVSVSIKRLNPAYFSSIDGYNQLMLSLKFYRSFNEFLFMLIYQLDAWVFSDDLLAWCNKDYDYIGAPWYEKKDKQLIFAGVGNGGFSLRKIRSHIKVLTSFSYVIKPGYFAYLLKRRFSLQHILFTLRGLLMSNNTFYLLNDFQENEDRFWGLIATRNFKWFKVPSEKEAKKFAIEVYPSKFITSKVDLPFGCHAWEKYEPEFWQRFIKVSDINL